MAGERSQVEVLGSEICELAAHLHAAQAQLVDLIVRYAAAGGWEGVGLRSCAHWLSVNAGFALRRAQELCDAGEALQQLPSIRAAFEAGELSFDKVRAIVSVAVPADEALWLETARQASGSQVARIVCAAKRALATDEADADRRQAARRGVSFFTEDDGMVRMIAVLDPADAAVVRAAVEAVANTVPLDDDDPAESRWAARRADALVTICEHTLATGADELRADPSTCHVDVHIGLDTLIGGADGTGETVEGDPLTAATARWLGCDATLRAIIERDGVPVDVRPGRRTATTRQRRAMAARDRRCQYPGCPVPAQRCQAHHVEHWIRGGRTSIAEMRMLCRYHHRRHHRGEFDILIGRDGETIVVDRFGRAIGRPPPPIPLEPETRGAPHLRLRNQAHVIGEGTAVAASGGERCTRFAMDVVLDNVRGARAWP